MNTAEFDRMFAIEETHWWYRGRRALVRQTLDRYAPSRRPLEVLDVACATGMSFRFLADYGAIRGVDISEETIRLCGQRGIDRILKADAMRLPFGGSCFDVVLALDAFEHFEDDVGAMAEVFRVLRPGGLLVATVPAFMSLWSQHDVAYHHYRRYRRGPFRQRLESVGFVTERTSYSTMTLFAPVFLLRRLRRSAATDEAHSTSDFALALPGPVERLAGWITRAELALERRMDLPFGVSLLGVMRKPEGC